MSARVAFRSAVPAFLLALALGEPAQAARMIQNTGTGTFTSGSHVRCGASGGFVHWNQKNISWFHNTSGVGAGKETALKNALSAWSQVPYASLSPSYAGTTTAGFVTDGQNTMVWGANQGCGTGCLALTALVLQPGQVIIETDITFNPSYPWNMNGAQYDVQAVAAHEIGHSLGLHHSELDDAPKPTMSTPYFGSGGGSLEGDDRLALQCTQEYFSETPLGVYQKRNDGSIWMYRGEPCKNGECDGWQRLDDYAQTHSIVADGENLFQLHLDGSIWRYNGKTCSSSGCGGAWEKVDGNSQTREIAAGGGKLYQLQIDGSVWRFTGEVCGGAGCPGWEMLRGPVSDWVMGITADDGQLYILQFDGSLLRSTGAPCVEVGCGGWQLVDNNYDTIALAAGGSQLYQLHMNGSIWRYTGITCAAGNCPGWQMIDNDPKSSTIAAVRNTLFMHRDDGSIWRYTGAACGASGCNGWEKVDGNPKTQSIVARGNQLYQMHDDGRVWRFTGQKCTQTACPGWQLTDEGSGTTSLAVAR